MSIWYHIEARLLSFLLLFIALPNLLTGRFSNLIDIVVCRLSYITDRLCMSHNMNFTCNVKSKYTGGI